MANETYTNYSSDPRFAAVFVIWQNDNFDRASLEFCRQVRQQYGLTMPVLVYADDGAAAAAGFDQRHVHLVTDADARIVHRDQFNDRSFRPIIDGLLGR